MQVLPESFAMFTYAGVWRPLNWSSQSTQATLYQLYTWLSIFLVYSLTLSELVGALLLTKSLEDFTDVSFLLLSTISVCSKTASILVRRRGVVDLVNMLMETQCLPRNAREIEIIHKFDRVTRFIALFCFYLAETTVAVMSIGPLFQTKENRYLPFKSWLPYELTSNFKFWTSYIHQSAAIVICATINVANDSMICGFMLMACSQLELLNHRLAELTKTVGSKKISESQLYKFESRLIAQQIRHHNHIFRFAKNMNFIFTPVIFIQFCMSSIVLSLSVYQLSIRSVNGVQFITMILYLTCMLVQFFMYSYFGDQISLASVDFGQAIYNTDWINLRSQTIKSLIIMMLRAKRPIVISCGFMIILSLKSFTSILKTSYSAFNLLVRSAA